jgi:hypothetical protein
LVDPILRIINLLEKTFKLVAYDEINFDKREDGFIAK